MEVFSLQVSGCKYQATSIRPKSMGSCHNLPQEKTSCLSHKLVFALLQWQWHHVVHTFHKAGLPSVSIPK